MALGVWLLKLSELRNKKRGPWETVSILAEVETGLWMRHLVMACTHVYNTALCTCRLPRN